MAIRLPIMWNLFTIAAFGNFNEEHVPVVSLILDSVHLIFRNYRSPLLLIALVFVGKIEF